MCRIRSTVVPVLGLQHVSYRNVVILQLKELHQQATSKLSLHTKHIQQSWKSSKPQTSVVKIRSSLIEPATRGSHFQKKRNNQCILVMGDRHPVSYEALCLRFLCLPVTPLGIHERKPYAEPATVWHASTHNVRRKETLAREVYKHPFPRRCILWVCLKVCQAHSSAPVGGVTPRHLPISSFLNCVCEHNS